MSKKIKHKNFIGIFIFMALITMPMISWYILSCMAKNDASIMEKFDFDLGEKRLKATLSETLNVDNITYEVEKYYNDRIPYRSMLINFKTILDAKIEKPYRDVENAILCFISGKQPRDVKYQAEKVDGVVKYYMDDAVDIYFNHGLTIKEFDPYNPYLEYPIKYTENENVIIGQSNWLFLNSANINLYTGKMSISDEEMKEYVNLLSVLDAVCKSVGKKFVVLICPEKEEIYPEYMPYMEIIDEAERAIKIRDYIATSSTIKYIYPKEELINAKSKYLTYRKYDSHWNYIGGYLAAKKVLESLGIKTIPLRNIPIAKVDMLGYELVPYGGLDIGALPKTFEYQVLYKLDVMVTQHSIPGTNNIASIWSESSAKNKEKMFLIGDSFSHALIQYLHKEFKEFYFNSFSDIFDKKISNDYLKKEIKNADVVMIELVERNDPALMSDICYKIGDILNEIYVKNK